MSCDSQPLYNSEDSCSVDGKNVRDDITDTLTMIKLLELLHSAYNLFSTVMCSVCLRLVFAALHLPSCYQYSRPTLNGCDTAIVLL